MGYQGKGSLERVHKARHKKITSVGDDFLHIFPPIVFKEYYSFTRLNRGSHV